MIGSDARPGYPLDPERVVPPLTWEPVSGFEPLACRLQEVRPRASCALAARMTRVIALMALTALGLSEAPVHEPVHGRRRAIRVAPGSALEGPPGTRWATPTGHSDRASSHLTHQCSARPPFSRSIVQL